MSRRIGAHRTPWGFRAVRRVIHIGGNILIRSDGDSWEAKGDRTVNPEVAGSNPVDPAIFSRRYPPAGFFRQEILSLSCPKETGGRGIGPPFTLSLGWLRREDGLLLPTLSLLQRDHLGNWGLRLLSTQVSRQPSNPLPEIALRNDRVSSIEAVLRPVRTSRLNSHYLVCSHPHGT